MDVLYVFNGQLDFIYYSIYNFFFLCIILDYKNLKFKHLIDNIAIHFFYLFGNFTNMKDMKKNIYNPTVNLSKFTSNKKILSEIAVLEYK